MSHQSRNVVTVEQIEALIAYMEANPELALGRFTHTTEGRSKGQRLWREVTDILNSLSPNFPRKEPKDWRAFYTEFKSKLLKKVKAQKAELCKTGGGKAKEIILTPLQDRLYTILGKDVGDPLPGVRHNPLQHESQGSATAENDTYFYSGQNVINESAYDQTFEEETEYSQSPSMLRIPPAVASTSSAEIVTWLSPNINTPASYEPQRRLPPIEPSRSRLSPERERSPPIPMLLPTPRRRLRQRRGQGAQPSLLATSQARLADIEKTAAEATLEHARATNRLAAAIEQAASMEQARATDRLAAAIEKLAETVTKTASQVLRIVLAREDGGSPAKKRCRRSSRLDIESDSE